MAALSGRLSPLHKGVKNAQTFRRNSDWLMPTGHEQLTHVLESTGVQLDVEVGWTTVGSQIRWSAAVSHGENVVAVVHDVVTPFGVDVDYAVRIAVRRGLLRHERRLREKLRGFDCLRPSKRRVGPGN